MNVLEPSRGRRRALATLLTLLVAGRAGRLLARPRVLAVRAWPGRSSTRVTIESDEALRFGVTVLRDPERLAIDLEE
ncbi:MAG: AMIN domain-containing protein, partial [Casimicrobiaceae bacterium]|nr:AMIN domain-containing protein [Casimicrobiaceae bacterium]